MIFNYCTIIIGMICGIILFFRLPRLSKVSVQKNINDLKISVIIPARNEEINLPNILSDLNNQTIRIHEIICVDDGSTDRTPAIIKEFGAKAVTLSSLPSGWKGKTWACQNGAKEATGDTALFLDADVRLSSTAIESLASIYQNNKNPISIQPYHEMKKQYEYFSLFFNLIEICATGMCLLRKKNTYGFYGPVFMVSKELFDEHGGYDVVRNHVIEDFSLGNYYSKIGIKINLLGGGDEIRFRMYPRAFFGLFEGWSKNFSTGSLSTKPWILAMIFFWIACFTAIPIEVVRAVSGGRFIPILIISAIYLFNSLSIYRIAKNVGNFPVYTCILYPIYLIVFHVTFIYSFLGTYIFKSTTWKGRKL